MDAGGGNPYGGLGDAVRQSLANKGSGLADAFGGIFNDPRDPWRNAQRDYDFYMDKAQGQMNPFIEGGKRGMGNYEDWLSGMKDPQEFINHIMGGYQESPYAKYLQDQTYKSGINAASASGLAGSTPWQQQAQQNAAGISSKDMQDWLGRVLGVNTQYGAGQQHMMDQGFNAATNQANIFGQRGADEAKFGFNKETAGQGRSGSILGGLWNTFFG